MEPSSRAPRLAILARQPMSSISSQASAIDTRDRVRSRGCAEAQYRGGGVPAALLAGLVSRPRPAARADRARSIRENDP